MKAETYRSSEDRWLLSFSPFPVFRGLIKPPLGVVFRKSVEDADYFVGLIFKVDARKEEGGGSIENFRGEKKEGRARVDTRDFC